MAKNRKNKAEKISGPQDDNRGRFFERLRNGYIIYRVVRTLEELFEDLFK